jgi:8-hydroxy-5-deazaflavin:NADPH oxidoreductase
VVRREQLAQARETVAVIGGTGALGFGLALRWALAGVPIVIGSRSEERASEAAERLRERAGGAAGDGLAVEGLENEEAARRARTVVLAVPFRAQSENLNNLRNALEAGTILVDATVPLAAAIGGRATRTLGVWQGSAAEQAQEMAPRGVTVVSALHTVSASLLSDPRREIDEDVLIAGDDRKAKDQVADLVRRIPGLRPVDCGDLEVARIMEQLTPLLISVNRRYKIKHSGIRLTGLEGADAPPSPAAAADEGAPAGT